MLETWRQERGLSGRETPEALAEDWVWHRYWADQIQSDADLEPLDARLEVNAWHLAAAAWLKSLEGAARPTESEIKAEFESLPPAEKRWQLSNIFLSYPPDATPAEKQEIKARLEALRDEVVTGEDFAKIAFEQSDSQTRRRSGRMGTASLSQLSGEFRSVVGKMTVGQVSPVVETKSGVTLLYCSAIHEPQSPKLEERRGDIERRLLQTKLEGISTEADQQMSRESPLVFDCPVPTASETRSDCLARLAVPGLENPITITRQHLSGLEATRELPPDQERLDLLEVAKVARRASRAMDQGLASGPEWERRVAAHRLVLEARLAIRMLVRTTLERPTEQELRALYESRPQAFFVPSRFDFRGLKVPIRPEWGADFYATLDAWGERLRKGTAQFSDLVVFVGDRGTTIERAWMSQSQAFALGKNVESELLELEPGEAAGPLQEARELIFVQLFDKEQRHRRSFEEVRQELEEAVLDRRLTIELADRRPTILAGLSWTLVP